MEGEDWRRAYGLTTSALNPRCLTVPVGQPDRARNHTRADLAAAPTCPPGVGVPFS
jgi:hypothetical protein